MRKQQKQAVTDRDMGAGKAAPALCGQRKGKTERTQIMGKTEDKTKRRYDGAISEVAELMKTAQAQRDAFAGFLAQVETIEVEIQKAAEAEKTLPCEIDDLLRSGRMDEKTIEQLARKRAYLDLIPGRLKTLREQIHALKTAKDLGAVTNCIQEAIYKGGLLFEKMQMETALPDYVALGVDEEIAKQQIELRPDIYHDVLDYNRYTMYTAQPWHIQMRMTLAAFDSLAAGLFPVSPAAEAIHKKWNVRLETA